MSIILLIYAGNYKVIAMFVSPKTLFINALLIEFIFAGFIYEDISFFVYDI